MIIKQIWTGNDYRNFNYVIACTETGEALAIDPLDSAKCLACANANGWDITQILNTHEHPDHIGGNAAMIEATGARLLAHGNAGPHISGIDRGLHDGDEIRVGKTVELLALDTPGHTMCHICVLSQTDTPALFSGDTLFGAGCGNCHRGGDPEQLFETFVTHLNPLTDDTLVYPGHDYLTNNLRFTLDCEPDNCPAARLLEQVLDSSHPDPPSVTYLAVEREVNCFLRLSNLAVINRLRESFSEMSPTPTPQEVFLRLRQLRNQW